MDSDDPPAEQNTEHQTENGTEVTTEDHPRVDVNPLDVRIEKGSIDPENALFVVLGMVLTVMIVVRFLSVLP